MPPALFVLYNGRVFPRANWIAVKFCEGFPSEELAEYLNEPDDYHRRRVNRFVADNVPAAHKMPQWQINPTCDPSYRDVFYLTRKGALRSIRADLRRNRGLRGKCLAKDLTK